MSNRILMKIIALLFSVVCIYVVIIWEPNLAANEDRDYNDTTKQAGNLLDNNETESNGDMRSSNREENNGIVHNMYRDNMFVVEFGEVNSKLSSDEKITVDKVLSKLSVTDCIRINKILSTNYTESYTEALNFIKKRVLKEDYKQLEGILHQYS